MISNQRRLHFIGWDFALVCQGASFVLASYGAQQVRLLHHPVFWAVRYKVYKVAVNHLRLRTAGSIPALPTISPARASLGNQPSFLSPLTTADGIMITRRRLNFTGWDLALVCWMAVFAVRFV
jgi:hypothetical protein